MFPERSPLHEELNEFIWIAVNAMCLIIVAKVVWIGQMIVTQFARFPIVDAHRIEHFVQPLKQSVGWSEVTGGCHCRVLEKLVYTSSAQVLLDAPVH